MDAIILPFLTLSQVIFQAGFYIANEQTTDPTANNNTQVKLSAKFAFKQQLFKRSKNK